MDNNTINSLKEALKFSPENIPLRLHLAETLLSLSRLEEAEEQYQKVLNINNGNEIAKFGLSKVFFKQDKYAQCNVVLEEVLEKNPSNFDMLLLHTRALLRENSIAAAVEVYQKILAINPNFTDEELDGQLKVNTQNTYENDDLDSKFIQNPSINFEDVGGMDAVKKEIELKIIQPLKHPEIYKAYGKKIGGGILLYGPPGCGKTFLAKATAGQVKARFISVSLNDILDMWMGNSEKNLHDIFELARRNKPCVLFFDEIDALGASRADMRQSAGRNLINQFLQELDGMESDNDGVLILGATNTPWHLDAAFRRPGRFDRIIFVPPPDTEARAEIFKLKLHNKPSKDVDFKKLANKTKHYSGADIEAIIDIAIEAKLEEAIRQGVPQPLRSKDLENAAKKHQATTKEWLASAKNYALYANQSGLYDDILAYLKIKE